MARAGLDCVVVDLQHGSVGWADLGAIIQAIDGAGSCAVVRVPWNDQPSIMRALDFGAAGVIVPMVSTAQEARSAADAVRYPPHGVAPSARPADIMSTIRTVSSRPVWS